MITLGEMKDSLESYIDECADEEFSENTIKRYERVAHRMVEFLSQSKSDDEEVKKSDVIAWKKTLSKYKPRSQRVFIIAANKFTRYCVTGDIADKDKCYLTLKNVRIQDAQLADNVATPVDIKKLMAVARKKGYKDIYIAVMLILRTGVRFDALRFFTAETVKNKNIVSVRTKSKMIDVIIPADLKKVINSYIKENGITSYLVPSRKDKDKPMSKSTFWWRLQKVATIAKVRKDRAHAHAFRHAFAKGLYDSGVPIAVISDLLGHKSVDTTRIYLRLTESEMKKVVNEFRPY